MICQRLYSSVTRFRDAISPVDQLSPASLSISFTGTAKHSGITRLRLCMKKKQLVCTFSFPSAYGFTGSISLTDH